MLSSDVGGTTPVGCRWDSHGRKSTGEVHSGGGSAGCNKGDWFEAGVKLVEQMVQLLYFAQFSFHQSQSWCFVAQVWVPSRHHWLYSSAANSSSSPAWPLAQLVRVRVSWYKSPVLLLREGLYVWINPWLIVGETSKQSWWVSYSPHKREGVNILPVSITDL